MTPEDKGRLAKAFRDAVDRYPDADVPKIGHADEKISLREAVERYLADEKFYESLDEDIASGKITLDKFIKILENDGPDAPQSKAPKSPRSKGPK